MIDTTRLINLRKTSSEDVFEANRTFGHLSTQSFYPPHHLTWAREEPNIVKDMKLKVIVESLRDWGEIVGVHPVKTTLATKGSAGN